MNKCVLFLFIVDSENICALGTPQGRGGLKPHLPRCKDNYGIHYNAKRFTAILITLLIVGLFGCMSPDPEQQKKRELQRDALKLRMGQALNPTDAEGHLELGKIYRELGESEEKR